MTTSIIRTARRHRYTIVQSQTIEDARLSWAARGLLLYLLAKPDNWKVIVKDLQRRGDLGRDGIYGLLKELREVGYIKFIKNRTEDGRIRGGQYYVYETCDASEETETTPFPE